MPSITNEYGKTFDIDAVAGLMDDDIREDLHAEGFATEQEFFDAYCKRHAAKFGEEFEFAKQNPQV